MMTDEVGSYVATKPRKTSLVRPQTIRRIVGYSVLILFCVLFILPVAWLFLLSLKSETEYVAWPIHWLPETYRFDNYWAALTLIPFFKYLWNSLALASIHTVLVQFTSAMAGFAFARLPSSKKQALFTLILATMMVPMVVTIIPQFVVYSQIGLVGTWWPWVLWGLSGQPFHIFLFRQFFASIPIELEEAAEVDGCSPFRIFWQIFIPNSWGVIAASSIFSFQWVWGDWFFPIIFLKNDNTTLAVMLQTGYKDPHGAALYTPQTAAVMLYILPLIIVFFLAQRHIIQGIVTTGIKG
jgi:multiple sugar transport system permease protein